jgi:hypothetical protein
MAIAPQIISLDLGGRHNADLEAARQRLAIEGAYKDLSTVVLVPAFGSIPTKVVASWLSLMNPPNGRVARIWALGLEVGEAFSQTIQNIVEHPELREFKYLLTLEHDNAPPSDGLVRLLATAEAHPELSAVGGLYWTKGPGGQPQIWGDPRAPMQNFRPQLPDPNGGLVECCGTGMGFTLFRLAMFRDERLRRPWFKTIADAEHGTGTQDLYFWGDARQYGHRCAIDCSVRVGHYDLEGKFGPPDTMW